MIDISRDPFPGNLISGAQEDSGCRTIAQTKRSIDRAIIIIVIISQSAGMAAYKLNNRRRFRNGEQFVLPFLFLPDHRP